MRYIIGVGMINQGVNVDFKKDFSKQVIKTLKKKGIELVGTTWLPSVSGDFSNGERGYRVDDNGTSKIKTYTEIAKLGESPLVCLHENINSLLCVCLDCGFGPNKQTEKETE